LLCTDAAYCNRQSSVVCLSVCWSVCWSVCLSVTIVSPAKTAEPSEMPFGMWTRAGPWNHVLVRVQIPTHQGAMLGKVTGPQHAQTCPVIDILQATQHGGELVLVRSGCRLDVLDGVHIGATWRIRPNRSRAAAMGPCVRLL